MRINQIAKYLGLKKPFSITLKSGTKNKATAKYWGLYSEKGKLESHEIKIWVGNLENPLERSLETLIAHELIHAWQEEKGFTDTHGESFKYAAERVSCEFDLERVYDPDLDTE